jgi:L-fucose mutarotase
MLKGIPPVLSPELLKVMAAMGHGDELVIGDCNFPAESMGRRCLRADGVRGVAMLDAILRFLPLDTFVDCPVALMRVVPGTLEGEPPVWREVHEIVERHQPGTKFELLERADFYARARDAYAIVATTERALYACMILKKGTLI